MLKKGGGLPRWHSGKESTLPVQVMPEVWVWSLVWEDALEEDGNPLQDFYWENLWTEESMGSQRVRHDSNWAHTCWKVSEITSCLLFVLIGKICVWVKILFYFSF